MHRPRSEEPHQCQQKIIYKFNFLLYTFSWCDFTWGDFFARKYFCLVIGLAFWDYFFQLWMSLIRNPVSLGWPTEERTTLFPYLFHDYIVKKLTKFIIVHLQKR